MATATVATEPSGKREWFITGRWQEYEGESRANVLRILAVGSFYIVELIRFRGLEHARADQLPFHRQATAIAVAWTMIGLAVLLLLRLRIFPAGLKYVSTACDVGLLTALAALATGPFSPLVGAYFVIVALAALRFSIPLIWFTTIAVMLGYWSLVGLADQTWFDADHVVPVTTQIVTLLSLALTGIVLGQAVRRVKVMAAEYAQRLAAARRIA